MGSKPAGSFSIHSFSTGVRRRYLGLLQVLSIEITPCVNALLCKDLGRIGMVTGPHESDFTYGVLRFEGEHFLHANPDRDRRRRIAFGNEPG
ncbi:hypothetical protein C7412_112227 [Paraburkholderia silvatlantica]|nr:hypothetical protein C7412_112227 [Paraburkholderia silvatlantica]